MNLKFLIELGFKRMDWAIAKSVGEQEKALDLMIDAYLLVHKKAYFDGYHDYPFDIESFLLIYPEYDADYYHHFYLGKAMRKQLVK